MSFIFHVKIYFVSKSIRWIGETYTEIFQYLSYELLRIILRGDISNHNTHYISHKLKNVLNVLGLLMEGCSFLS